MFFCVTSQNHGQRTVSGYVTCSSKAVLQSENRQHQSCTCLTEAHDSGDQT